MDPAIYLWQRSLMTDIISNDFADDEFIADDLTEVPVSSQQIFLWTIFAFYRFCSDKAEIPENVNPKAYDEF